MHQCQHRASRKTDILEPEPDIDQNADRSDNDCNDCVLTHLIADSRRNRLEGNRLLINAKRILNGLGDRLSLIQRQHTCLDVDIIRACHLLRLNLRIAGHILEQRLYFGINVADRQILIERNARRCTATEIHAQVQCAIACAGIDCHCNRACQNADSGNRKGNLPLADKIDHRTLLCLSVILLILEAKLIEGSDEQSGNYQRRKHGKHDTERQCLCKAFDTSGTKKIQNKCSDQRGNITVNDRRERFFESGTDRAFYGCTFRDLLTDTRIDDNVRIDCHTDRQDDTCDTRQGQRQIKCIQAEQHHQCINHQCDTCTDTRQCIDNNHENNNDRKSDRTCNQACADRILTELCSDHVGADLLQLKGQGTDTDRRSKVLGLFGTRHTGDDRRTTGDRLIDTRCADDIVIVYDLNDISDIFGRRICKCLCTILGQLQLYDVFTVAHVVLLLLCAGICHLVTGQYDCAVGQTELQRTRLAKLFENRIGIADARDLDIDSVRALLVYLSLCTVALYTLLQLVDGIIHVLCRRLLISDSLIGNAHTTGKVQAQDNIPHSACTRLADTDDYRICK